LTGSLHCWFPSCPVAAASFVACPFL
jgi:hypothetical protein